MTRMQMFLSLAVSLITLTSLPCYAEKTATHVVVAPNCLITKVDHTYYQLLAKDRTLTLFATTEAGIDQLIAAKIDRQAICGGFMDVTVAWKKFNATRKINQQNSLFLQQYSNTSIKSFKKIDYKIQYENEVNNLLKELNPQDLWNDLTTLTHFPDRSASTDNGVLAAKWLAQQITQLAETTGHHDDVSITLLPTGNLMQPSVIAKFGTGTGPAIVIGGHMDTLSSTWGLKPGADDDGTGTVTVLETARLLLSSQLHFKKPIYFIWYAAEERGLVGSQYVVADFKEKKIPVDAVIHFDMTGYTKNNNLTMWLMDDYVNPDLTAYLETLINTYVKQPVKHSRCGYACSDHASWTKGGFAAAIPFETEMNKYDPYIHTAQDTMDVLSLAHMTDFAKLGAAFAVEMAEPITK